MPSKKVPEIQPLKHTNQRNGFDLTQSHTISFAPGILYPVLTLDCIAGDNIKLNVHDLIKSKPITSAPFLHMKGVYEFYFVPYNQLWHSADQFFTQQIDYKSAAFSKYYDEEPPTKVPLFTKEPIKINEGTTENIFTGSLDYWKYKFTDKNISGYQTVKDYMGNPIYEALKVYNDLLGYGYVEDKDKLPNSNMQLNMFRWAALDKIYQDYYRKEDYETYETDLWSLDDGNDVGPTKMWNAGRGYYYRNYGMDVMSNILPSAGFNINQSNRNVINNIIPQNYINSIDAYAGVFYDRYTGGPVTNPSIIRGDAQGYQTVGYGTGADKNINSNLEHQNSHGLEVEQNIITASALRTLYALDKLSMTMGRASKNYVDQMKAVYGIDVSAGRDGKCTYIGGCTNEISVGEIDNTNGASAGAAYSSYGKINSVGSGNIDYNVPENGILMCIYSIIPLIRYDSTRISPFVTKESYNDYFNPFYENIGMQPLEGYTIDYINIASGNTTNLNNNAIGWQPRFSEYKTAIDINHDEFNKGHSLENYTTSRTRNGYSNYGIDKGLNAFKINSGALNTIFNVNFDGKPSTAPFFGEIDFNIVKITNMGNGMPNLL